MPMTSRSLQRGLSLVEAMVGLTVGLIIVAGATMLVTTQISEHRRLTTETQMQQDLRAAADLILYELRRSGTWEQASLSVWAPGAAAPIGNPYSAITPATTTSAGSRIDYKVSKASRGGTEIEDNAADASEERAFYLETGTLFYQLSSDTKALPQPLTDPNSMKVTEFKVKVDVQALPLDSFCTVPCPVGSTCTLPKQEVRQVTVSITGETVSKPVVSRHVQVSTRLRNDNIVGACP